MNWNQLQYVLVTAEEGGITRAADRLFLSQPSLSRSLQSLEKELGTPLFERKQGHLVLTYAGELFCQWANATLHSHQELQQKLNDIVAQRRYLIRIGISPHRSHLFLPVILKRFYENYPECELHILEKPTFELKELMEQGKLDLLIDLPHQDTVNYQNDRLVDEQIMVAVPKSYLDQLPLGCHLSRSIPLGQLSDLPFVLMSTEHVIGRVCQQICHAANVQPKVRLYCSSLEGALNLTREQLGITFVPEVIGAEGRFGEEIRYFYVDNCQISRQICMVYPKELFISKPLTVLMELFREIVPKLYQGETVSE